MLGVDGGSQLSLVDQRGWGIHDRQHQLDQSDSGVLVERLVLGQLVPLTGGGDSVVLVVLGTESLQQHLVLPVLNLVVLSGWTVNQLLDGVTVVVQDEQVWLQVPSDHSGDLLNG